MKITSRSFKICKNETPFFCCEIILILKNTMSHISLICFVKMRTKGAGSSSLNWGPAAVAAASVLVDLVGNVVNVQRLSCCFRLKAAGWIERNSKLCCCCCRHRCCLENRQSSHSDTSWHQSDRHD